LVVKLKAVLRVNVINNKTLWIPYDHTSRIIDVKKSIKYTDINLESAEDIKDIAGSILLLFNHKNINDDVLICQNFIAGDLIDL
jgi:hypothetical protein